MKITPINIAEAVIEPFWDEAINEFPKWEVKDGGKWGLQIFQWWCSVNFSWVKKSDDGIALSMTRSCCDKDPNGMDLGFYDTIIVSLMAPEHGRVRISAKTDLQDFEVTTGDFGQYKREIELSLKGSKKLLSISIDILYDRDEPATGWLNWIGLSSTERLPLYFSQFERFDEKWEGSIYPEGVELSYKPKHEIFFSDNDLEDMRKSYKQAINEGAKSPFAPDESYELYFQPEKCIGDFVNFWDDTRYCRERDSRHYLIKNGVRAAMLGVLEKDPAMLRLAARYAMSIVLCKNWDDGMICVFPEGAWEHRCFVQSLCLYDIVFIYDLASEYFTPSAKEHIFRRIAEEGMSSINYITWKHEYIFGMNQLIWFSHGRMAGYSLLLKEWPRVKPHMEIAYNEAVENIQNTVLPDGGYLEGPTYFSCIGYNGGQALHLYARAVSKDISEVVPQNLKNAADFAQALASTNDSMDMIPICDARGDMPHIHLAFMAYMLKDSRWVDIYQKAVKKAGGLPEDYFSLMVGSKLSHSECVQKPFVKLDNMRLVASERKLNERTVKLLVLGNCAGAGHTHEDKGSFVLEFGGETYAMDLGTCDYSSTHSLLYKNCQRHNMLVPTGSNSRVAPCNPCMDDITPTASGDEKHFEVELEPGIAFTQYKSWIRQIESPSPDEITIFDEYELSKDSGCDGVEFYWNTMLDCSISGGKVEIHGKNGTALIEIPNGCECRIDKIEIFDNKQQNRIAFTKKETKGSMKVSVKLY